MEHKLHMAHRKMIRREHNADAWNFSVREYLLRHFTRKTNGSGIPIVLKHNVL